MNTFRQITMPALITALAVLALAWPGTAFASGSGVVNINNAEVAQLQMLPRVGPALAERIVDFRKQNGDFDRAADLILVRGIGDKTFALLEPYVVLKGETTLSAKVRSSDLTSPSDTASKGSTADSSGNAGKASKSGQDSTPR